jgi:hypothetical protein
MLEKANEIGVRRPGVAITAPAIEGEARGEGGVG